MKRHFVWILATLVLIEFLSLDLIGFAGDGKWVRNTNMPTARWGLSTCVVNGKIYAIGGCGPEAPVNAVEEYDPATDTWRWKDSMPSGIYALSTSVVNGKISAVGGSFLEDLPTAKDYTFDFFHVSVSLWFRMI